MSQRNAASDRGIGVCGQLNILGICGGGNSWFDNTDEIDRAELLNLRPVELGLVFDGTFGLSSLDNNGDPNDPNNREKGWMRLGNNNLDFVSFDSSGILAFGGTVSSATLTKPMNGITEDNTWLLTVFASNISDVADVYFFSGCRTDVNDCGFNNDYLVAGTGVRVIPLPAALPMFLAALAGLGLIGRRKD